MDNFNKGVHTNEKEVKKDSNSTSVKSHAVRSTSSLKSSKKKSSSRSKSVNSSLYLSKGSLGCSEKIWWFLYSLIQVT